ncbi:MAG: DUF1573 domain-containing protein [Planctomycetes bacterium]|nr:DUF1573 domain-containing protein [Planctomycetia bacterium]MBI3468827.1 DUF1573 domain-containing protein [Planctomycetota bacterium]
MATKTETDAPTRIARRKRWPLWVLMAGILVAAGFVVGSLNLTGNPANLPLQADAGALHFGNVWAQPNFTWNVPLHNTSQYEVRVEEVAGLCRCTVPSVRDMTIPPGETRSIPLRIDLLPRGSEEAAAAERDFAVELALTYRHRLVRHRQLFTINGKVRKLFAAQPATAVFDRPLLLGESDQESIRVRTRFETDVADVQAQVDPALAAARLEAAPNDKSTFDIVITPSARLPVGRFAFDVVLAPVARNGDALPHCPIPVRGVVVQDAFAIPENVCFAGQRPGGTETQTLAVQSRNHRAIATVHVEGLSEGDGLSARTRRADASPVCYIDLTWTPALAKQPAPTKVTLIVTYASGESAWFDVAVSIPSLVTQSK